MTTDIIVGFPGETEADFVRTLEVAAEADYDAAYTFVFSPRPGTEAALMIDDFVAPEVIQERMARLVAVVEGSALRRHEARVGRIEELLVEGPSKKDPASGRGGPARTSSCTSRPTTATASRRPRRWPDHQRGAPLSCGPTSCGLVKPAPRRRVRIPVAVV